MKKNLIVAIGITLMVNNSAHAINAKYRKQLERSGCTQVTEAQGCDITKTKEENAKAGSIGAEASQNKPASLEGIKGMNAIKAIDEMTTRGFAGVDSISSGNTLYGVYFNRSTRQCIQLTTADNKVIDVNDIHTHPKCR